MTMQKVPFVPGADTERAVGSVLAISATSEGLLSKKQVVARTGLSRATIDRERRANRFPHPLKLSARRVGWLASEIENWIAARLRVGVSG